MRAFVFLLVAVICFSCSGSAEQSRDQPENYKGRDLKNLEAFQTVQYQADFILSYILDSCQHLSTFAIHEDTDIMVTPKMFQLMKFSGFNNTCFYVQEHIGEAQERELAEAFFGRRELTKIFRYKVKSEKQKVPIEIRIILTDQNKLTEFQFYEWSDDYRPDMIKMPWFGMIVPLLI